MSEHESPHTLILKYLSKNYVLLLVVAAFSAQLAALRVHYSIEVPDANLAHLMDGTASTPFQYRVLLPLLAREVAALGAAAHVHITTRAIYLASDTIFIFGIFIVALLTLRHLELSRPQVLVAILGLSTIIETNYLATNILNMLYIYDMPAVFFSFLGTHFLFRRKFVLFYIMLPIALLNRETAVFLCLLFLLTNIGHMRWSRLFGHMFAQGAIALVIKGAVTAAFWNSPGVGSASFYAVSPLAESHSIFDLRLFRNLGIFFKPRPLLHQLSIFGFMWVPYLFALRVVGNPFFKAAAWVFPPFVLVMLLVGNIDEFRIFSELIPLVFFTVVIAWSQWDRRAALAEIDTDPS